MPQQKKHLRSRWPPYARPAPRNIRPLICSAVDVVALLPELQEAEQELCCVIGLDGRHRVTITHCAAIGTVDHVSIALRDVFREVVRHNCAAIVVTHNHPSGNPSPSRSDHELTRSLIKAGALLGMSLLDHVIVAREGVYSYAESGQLTRLGE